MADVRGTFTKELALIQNDLITMGQLVTQALADAVEALKTKNKDLADSVIAGDDKIDEMQVIIEDKTVELIALQQPIAKDLRILSTAMKMTTDLERIGDHAKKIAKIANRIGQDPLIKPLVDIPIAAQMVQEMVKKVLKSYIELDVNAAAEVCIADDKVDEICDTCKRDILFYMMKDQANIEQGLDLNKVVQRIERIGDHATNLAEWVIYLVTGQRVPKK
ncbi:MAG: phosphate signaling complex protein PhoU [Acidaminococcaceae bacterium]|nr:phosphate signaling complex protein PhoU [Acidaminococcaceae bacterium]